MASYRQLKQEAMKEAYIDLKNDGTIDRGDEGAVLVAGVVVDMVSDLVDGVKGLRDELEGIKRAMDRSLT